MFAVQIAKSFGANVTGVCSTANMERIRSIGADQVIDYIHEDFTKSQLRYDLILAVNGYHPLSRYKRCLTTNGAYVAVGGSFSQIFQSMLIAPLLSKEAGQRLGNLGIARVNPDDLEVLKALLETGKIVPVIDKRYPLSETAQALMYLNKKHARGKVVIVMP